MMRPVRFWLVGFLGVMSLSFFSCFFDEDSDATSWLEDSDIPVTVGVQEVEVSHLKPMSMSVGIDTLPFSATVTGGLGAAMNTRQELFLDMMVLDDDALDWYQDDSSSWMDVLLTLDSTFYLQMAVGDSMPLYDGITVHVGWKLDTNLSDDDLDSLEDMKDTTWRRGLLNTVLRGTETWPETSYAQVLKLDSVLGSVSIALPDTLQQLLRQTSGEFRLQLHLVFDHATRVYRFQGPGSDMDGEPELRIFRYEDDTVSQYDELDDDSTDYLNRMAQVGYDLEMCDTCLVLHGGIRESLLVELPTDSIWAALVRTLGDSLMNDSAALDSLIGDRIVLLAKMDIVSDTSMDNSELGLPTPVRAYAQTDTLEVAGVTGSLLTELLRYDTTDVKTNGYPNLLFLPERDTLQIQISRSLRYWLQSAHYGNAGD
ncbi:MAG TPA: hypothetical protein VLM37_04255, partial [Fibrobacteraceae bacterium]|nr:hypothetical protein [Fibrobacteraceae bacterium]